MGKTYEALERAQKEFHKNLLEIPHKPRSPLIVRESRQISMKAPADRFHELKTRLTTRFSEGSIKTIMFTSTAHGSGSSTTAVNFATTLARDCRLNVLLIDANLRTPRLHELFDIEYNKGLSNLLTMEEDETLLYKKAGHGNLYVIPSGKKGIGPLTIFESVRFEKKLKMMRERFDYIILDAPPMNGYAESRVIATKVDGVILVIESGKTRSQVAIRAKQELEEAGAKVLGVILNRRKYYIPDWVYKRL
jgi:protein-tyrosine kinase